MSQQKLQNSMFHLVLKDNAMGLEQKKTIPLLNSLRSSDAYMCQ